MMHPTESLRAARRKLESIEGVLILADLKWAESLDRWAICVRLGVDSFDTSLIPSFSNWWYLVDDGYPRGRITVYPAKEDGIVGTFAHQNYNGLENSECPWKSGNVCVNSPQSRLGRDIYDPDPIGQVDRLAWYVKNTQRWLIEASRGNLFAVGEPFELPQFPTVHFSIQTLGYAESPESFAEMMEQGSRYGLAELAEIGAGKDKHHLVRRFLDARGQTIRELDWGASASSSRRSTQSAIWVLGDAVPVLPPFQGPATWRELLSACRVRGELLDRIIFKAFDLVRDGRCHFLLIGMPFQDRIGEPNNQIHWQPLLLPTLSHGVQYANGFRANKLGQVVRDRKEVIPGHSRLDWHKGENWSESTTSSRGRIAAELSEKSLLLIGAGALGSVLGELLVRSGVTNLAILDRDDLKMGNLCRHTLGHSSLGKNKATELSAKLNDASIHAVVEAKPDNFVIDTELESNYDLVIDCTGSDDVLYEMAAYDWSAGTQIHSLSLSFGAKRIYVFTGCEGVFDLTEFKEQIHPWLEKDIVEHEGEDLVFERSGCWDATFPARIDDVWLLAAAAFKVVEEAVVGLERVPKLTVLEQQQDDSFVGIKRH